MIADAAARPELNAEAVGGGMVEEEEEPATSSEAIASSNVERLGFDMRE
jgi:hypothetical protein